MNDKLVSIQQELKVPKGQTNSFGGYKYRSCEDILEAVKPLVHAMGLSLVLTDEVVQVGDANYIKASAVLCNGTDSITVHAMAREAVTKKGMDDAQITGSASSYARKYALNGLFAIDDTKDADTHDNTQYAAQPRQTKEQQLAKSKREIMTLFADRNIKDTDAIGMAIELVLGKATVSTLQEADEVLQALSDGII